MIYSDAPWGGGAFILTHPANYEGTHVGLLTRSRPMSRLYTTPPPLSLFTFIFNVPLLSQRAGRDCPLSRLRWG